MDKKNDGKSKSVSREEGVVAHIFKKFVVPDKSGAIVRGLEFGSIILSIKVISIDITGKSQRAYEIEALVPVKKIQGVFRDLNFEETVKKEFGHSLPEKSDKSKS